MTGRLNISAISRRTGVAPDTLRKWEQRYSVLRPTRTSGGQRRFSDHDVARVEWLRDRLREGWRIGEAALLLDDHATPSLADPADLLDALVVAAESAHGGRVTGLLDQCFTVLPVTRAIDEVIVPLLAWIGDAWQRGELSIAQEHAVSAKIRARLEHLMSDGRGAARGIAVLACAPTEQRDLGLLMLAVALHADGWQVEYLGADVPVDEALAYTVTTRANVLCSSAARDESLARLRQGLTSVAERPAHVVGGAAVTRELAATLGSAHAEEGVDAAVDRLRSFAASQPRESLESRSKRRRARAATSRLGQLR
ncbi:MAG: MerR family transcriptional regulator [Gaiella sp.]